MLCERLLYLSREPVMMEPPHVAQQSRRDKLRCPDPSSDLVPLREVRNCDTIYDAIAVLPPPTMIDFTAGGGGDSAASFLNPSAASFLNPAASGFHHQSGNCDWMSSYAGPSNNNNNNNNNGHPSNLFPSSSHLYHPAPSDLSFYGHNALQEVVTASSSASHRQPSPWVDAGGPNKLALSLSSNPNPPPPPPPQLGVADGAGGVLSWPPPPQKLPASGGERGGYGTHSGPPVDAHRCVGPLGPFTGYATILRGSKFLKPAQQLLDEFCSVVAGSKQLDGSATRRAFKCDDGSSGVRGNSAAVSSSSTSFYSSTEADGGEGSRGQIRRPEFQQKKAKLLYMQEEVCRRYKQYHQQIQMVVSSFESVAGLSAAAPYTSLALRAFSKHFRCIKNAISDQLRHVSKVLGEDLMSSSSPPSSSRGDTTTTTTPRLKYMEESLSKSKVAGESSLGFLHNSQPVWRPQRGLPERAVSVLRGWLFEHFLHPYPTDTEKHMLASQTGLSRNQVSNWFINARVRLWKPMVEEIHMLETKGAGMDLNTSNRVEGIPVGDDAGQPCYDQRSEADSNRPLDCSSMGPLAIDESSHSMEQWHPEKRARMEDSAIPACVDNGLMSFAYQGGMDMAGLGAVSLTLGLRHNECPQQQQQQQQMRHFSGHMFHDFVG